MGCSVVGARTMTVQEADTGRASFAGPAWSGALKTTALGRFSFCLSPRGGGEGGAESPGSRPMACASLMQRPKGENGHRDPGQAMGGGEGGGRGGRGMLQAGRAPAKGDPGGPSLPTGGARCSQGRACAVPANESEPGILALATADDAPSRLAPVSHLRLLPASPRALRHAGTRPHTLGTGLTS